MGGDPNFSGDGTSPAGLRALFAQVYNPAASIVSCIATIAILEGVQMILAPGIDFVPYFFKNICSGCSRVTTFYVATYDGQNLTIFSSSARYWERTHKLSKQGTAPETELPAEIASENSLVGILPFFPKQPLCPCAACTPRNSQNHLPMKQQLPTPDPHVSGPLLRTKLCTQN